MNAEPDTTTNLSEHCLSLDLEVGVREVGDVKAPVSMPLRRCARIGINSLILRPTRSGLAEALAKLDNFADGVDFVLGHNLIDFRFAPPASREPQSTAIAAARGRYPQAKSPSLPPQPVSPLG